MNRNTEKTRPDQRAPQIAIETDTWMEINSRKYPGETFNDVIVRLLNDVSKHESQEIR
jgi:hypothetical protein